MRSESSRIRSPAPFATLKATGRSHLHVNISLLIGNGFCIIISLLIKCLAVNRCHLKSFLLPVMKSHLSHINFGVIGVIIFTLYIMFIKLFLNPFFFYLFSIFFSYAHKMKKHANFMLWLIFFSFSQDFF